MQENPYEAPCQPSEETVGAVLPPEWMPRAYHNLRRLAVLGTGVAFLIRVLSFPPCGCGFAVMPSWKAEVLIFTWLIMLLFVVVGVIGAVQYGVILWIRHGIPCPGVLVALACLAFIVLLSLPLFG